MAQPSTRVRWREKIALSLVSGSLVVHRKIFRRRVRVITCIRITNRAGERSGPRRINTARKGLSDWSGNWGRIGGLKAISQLHAKPVTSSLRTIDIRGGITAYSVRGSAFVGLEGRRWRRENRIRALTVIGTRRVTDPLAEGLWLAIVLLRGQEFILEAGYLAHVQRH